MALLAIYYHCSVLAEDGLLSQPERFACNDTYQEIKRRFLDEELSPGQMFSPQQNRVAYLRFKLWEADNADVVMTLKGK